MRDCRVAVVALIFLSSLCVAQDDSPEAIRFFESKVRPLLAKHCLKCHGAKRQEAGLRLDTAEGLKAGGDSGAVVDTAKGTRQNSLLLRAVHRKDGLEMPPEKPLDRSEIRTLEEWVAFGAPFPAAATRASGDGSGHWAFQPVKNVRVPGNTADDWSRTEIDRFIKGRLTAADARLRPSKEAAPATLVRRASLLLRGLPPSVEEVSAFLNQWQQDSEQAWLQLIDQMLASPEYGEHQARQWLDVARYADNKGYVFFEEKNFPWSWTYRDWVIRAFNEDMPFDRFVRLQLAADQIEPQHSPHLAAMGFLTLGPRFVNNTHDIMDDRIDVVTRGLMGLTVTCARCHDHKFDPIPTADYYSLYGIFRSSREPSVGPLIAPPPDTDEYRAFAAELRKRTDALGAFVNSQRQLMMSGARERAAEYLLAAWQRRNHPDTENFMLLTDKGSINPAMLKRWEVYLKTARRQQDSFWRPWFMVADLEDKELATGLPKIGGWLETGEAVQSVNPLLRSAWLNKAPRQIDDVVAIYGDLLKRIHQKWQQQIKSDSTLERMKQPAEETIRLVLYGKGAPAMVPQDLGWGFLDLLPDRPTQNEYKKLLGAVETQARSGKGAPPRAMALEDASVMYDPVIFRRGNPNREGPAVPRRFLKVLSPEARAPYGEQSGRLQLAEAIVDPRNPLTARVFVNRIWQQHFGAGLVSTPSDFGLQGKRPSHPELLDWLAKTFLADGGSLKKLHRRILMSSVFRQAATATAEVTTVAQIIDPANRLLWRFPRRRQSLEVMRDAHLSVSGSLQNLQGGPPAEIYAGYQPRRTIYGFVNRMDLPTLMRTFDFPEPAATSGQREATTVPQQALFFLNHSFVRESAIRLLKRPDVGASLDTAERITRIYRLLFSREPSSEELELAQTFVNADKPAAPPTPWRYGYGGVDEKTQRTSSFHELTHSTGTRIQAGPVLPDPKLGWVFHDRTGGHPASSSDHCFVLRWISPIDGKVRISGTLTHRPEPGNGVRARIVCSDQGIAGTWRVDQSSEETISEAISVFRGSTIDFVVDWQGHITHDEFEWPVTITNIDGDRRSWDSKEDFRQPVSDPWTDYVHALLMTNEFVFVE